MSDRPAETEYSALQALLQIRSNSAQGEGSAAGEEGDGAARAANANPTVPTAAAAGAGATTTNASSFAHLLRMGGSNAATLLQQQQASHQVSYTPAQLAAVRAAAAASTLGRSNLLLQNPSLSVAAAAAVANRPTAAAAATIHHSPLLEAMARDPSLAAAAAVAAAPLSPPIELPRSPALSPIRPSTSRPMVAPTGAAITTVPAVVPAPTIAAKPELASATEDKADKKIRKDEVEAALRSKPQRGRKRENLNAEERLELTRTRNREHAKSTRIRKKARYQELLDTEQKYLELKTEGEINVKRKETMIKFLDARAQMLNETATKRRRADGETEEGTKHDTTAQGSRQSSENRAVSFDRAEVGGLLNQVLRDEKSFKFETSLGDISTQDYSAMSLFDEFVAGRFEELLGRGSSYSFRYRVSGSEDGIALNKDGAGFAKVDLVASEPSDAVAFPKENDRILQSSLVSFQFGNDSPLLRSVSWCVLKDVLDSSSSIGGKSESTAKDSLESQTVYPSVVSFDENHRERAKEMAAQQDPQPGNNGEQSSEENPGMSI